MDELILINDAIFKRQKEELKVNALVHGLEPPEDEEEAEELEGELDDRVLEMEREYLKKKDSGESNEKSEFNSIGLGFSPA